MLIENTEEEEIYKLIEFLLVILLYNYMFIIYYVFCQFWHNYQSASYSSSLDGLSLHLQSSLLLKVSVCSDVSLLFPLEEFSILNGKKFLLYRILHTTLRKFDIMVRAISFWKGLNLSTLAGCDVVSHHVIQCVSWQNRTHNFSKI